MARRREGLERPRQENTASLLLQYIPKLVRSEFKATCARRDKSMSQVLRKFMKTYAESGGAEPKFEGKYQWRPEDK